VVRGRERCNGVVDVLVYFHVFSFLLPSSQPLSARGIGDNGTVGGLRKGQEVRKLGLPEKKSGVMMVCGVGPFLPTVQFVRYLSHIKLLSLLVCCDVMRMSNKLFYLAASSFGEKGCGEGAE